MESLVLQNQSGKDVTTSLLKNLSLADLVIVTKGGNNSGTWMHEDEAILHAINAAKISKTNLKMFGSIKNNTDICGVLDFTRGGISSPNSRAFFMPCSKYLGSDPRAERLMPRLPLVGLRQRESGTLFLFPHFTNHFKVLEK